MTTVAARAGQMAADTQLTGEYTMRVQKIMRLSDGSIAGGAGIWRNAYAALLWLDGGSKGDPPSLEETDILVMRPDGSLWLADGGWPLFPVMDKQAAIGCGRQVAMHVMQKGGSAGDAVKAAIEVDPNTSGPVQMLELAPKRTRKP